MQKFTVRSVLLIGALALALSGCGQKPLGSNGAQGSEPSGNTANSPQTTPPPAQKEVPQDTKKEQNQLHIKSYYGDELATKLVEKEVTINFKEDKDKYTAALWTLKKAPQNSNLVPLAEALGFKSAVLKEKKLTLDLTVSGEGRLGAPGEAMLLEAIKKTLFQFKEIDSIDILVDGKAAESLMGHMDLPHPIKRGE
ncbi:GerMN domain-containing protein [Paenibacillus sp. NPDC056579]|uniref:GerMN domain-containing protein n=1 Tax=unclassified Paenibacillus TaxID=185978 RepID=UPI001EF83115|nr:GerMN domain-containing protein [Paenibacillus sp. H1-7]ULL18611.1 hypothetical protein DVH26_31555 [Paenibacillus sp. H1-7]